MVLVQVLFESSRDSNSFIDHTSFPVLYNRKHPVPYLNDVKHIIYNVNSILEEDFKPRGGGGGGGCTRTILDLLQTHKNTQARNFRPQKNTWHQNFQPPKIQDLILTVFLEHTSLKKISNEYFSDPLITMKTRNEKFAQR